MTSKRTEKSTHVHVAMNWVNHSTRMLKQTASILEAGLAEKIYLVGKWEPSVPESEDLGDGREIVRLKPWSGRLPKNSLFGLLVQIELTIRLLVFCRKIKPTVIQCHWIEALPVGYLYRRTISKQTLIVYDAHELETEKYGVHNTFKKPLYQWLERLAIHSADHVVVVSPSIARWYEREYGLKNLSIVRNIPSRRYSVPQAQQVDFRRTFDIREDEIIFIYQGRLAPARGLEMIMEAFASLPRRFHIIFMGFGPLESEVREFCRKYENTHFQPAVPSEKILSYSRAADVGLSLIENACLSYFYCLPNKLFEYVLSGVPVVVSDFPDMGEIVSGYRCGWAVEPSAEGLRQTIMHMSLTDLARKKANAQEASSKLAWRFEAATLVAAYRGLFDEQGVRSPSRFRKQSDSRRAS
jgi:glycosyltransferase involved in cell wall biosynthesis